VFVVLAAPLLFAATGLVVVGERDGCPSRGAVATRLGQLLPDETVEAPDALVVDGEPGALRVRLLSAQGSVREEKTLDLEGSCDELADAVATVAVAWRSRLQADVDVPPPVLVARARPVVNDRPAARPRAQPDFELAMGLQTISGPERWAPGLLLGAQAPMAHGFSLAFTLNVAAPRSAQDQTFKTWRWMEVGAVLAPSYRGTTDNLLVDASVGAGLGFNITTSESLSAPDSWRVVPFSVVSGMRWTYRHSQALPWFGVTFAARVTRLFDSPIDNAEITPEAWTLALALGGTFAFDVR